MASVKSTAMACHGANQPNLKRNCTAEWLQSPFGLSWVEDLRFFALMKCLPLEFELICIQKSTSSTGICHCAVNRGCQQTFYMLRRHTPCFGVPTLCSFIMIAVCRYHILTVKAELPLNRNAGNGKRRRGSRGPSRYDHSGRDHP